MREKVKTSLSTAYFSATTELGHLFLESRPVRYVNVLALSSNVKRGRFSASCTGLPSPSPIAFSCRSAAGSLFSPSVAKSTCRGSLHSHHRNVWRPLFVGPPTRRRIEPDVEVPFYFFVRAGSFCGNRGSSYCRPSPPTVPHYRRERHVQNVLDVHQLALRFGAGVM